uniref:Uncharacterized protein n=1 Tax=Oryza meridionalis TaxID=40149 RepID=A0A0E0E1V6_9ORYZ
MVVLGVWWHEGLSYSSPRQQIDGEGGGGGVLADAKDVEEAALPIGVSSEDKGKMGSVRYTKKDDANVNGGVGSPASTRALAFRLSQGTSFPARRWNRTAGHVRKSNGRGDLVGAWRFGRNDFVYSQWSRTRVTIGENGARWTMGMETRCLGPPAVTSNG